MILVPGKNLNTRIGTLLLFVLNTRTSTLIILQHYKSMLHVL